jgi:E3 ubiquitin-protein ligase UBR4
MKQNALQGVVPSETEDLNVEHLQLLLLIFHSFSEKGRRAILTMLVQSIQELSVNMEVQMRTAPLILARLLLIFDYLLHQYSKAPVYLFEQVKTHTLSLFSCQELHSLQAIKFYLWL